MVPIHIVFVIIIFSLYNLFYNFHFSNDYSECISDESMHAMRNEDNKDTETEENDNDTCKIDSMPTLLIRNNDTDADLRTVSMTYQPAKEACQNYQLEKSMQMKTISKNIKNGRI